MMYDACEVRCMMHLIRIVNDANSPVDAKGKSKAKTVSCPILQNDRVCEAVAK